MLKSHYENPFIFVKVAATKSLAASLYGHGVHIANLYSHDSISSCHLIRISAQHAIISARYKIRISA